jgi:hypothetical protein
VTGGAGGQIFCSGRRAARKENRDAADTAATAGDGNRRGCPTKETSTA